MSYLIAWNQYNCAMLSYLISRHEQVKPYPQPKRQCAQREYRMNQCYYDG